MKIVQAIRRRREAAQSLTAEHRQMKDALERILKGVRAGMKPAEIERLAKQGLGRDSDV